MKKILCILSLFLLIVYNFSPYTLTFAEVFDSLQTGTTSQTDIPSWAESEDLKDC